MTVNSIMYLKEIPLTYMSIHSSCAYFFSSLVSQEATLSILLTLQNIQYQYIYFSFQHNKII